MSTSLRATLVVTLYALAALAGAVLVAPPLAKLLEREPKRAYIVVRSRLQTSDGPRPPSWTVLAQGRVRYGIAIQWPSTLRENESGIATIELQYFSADSAPVTVSLPSLDPIEVTLAAGAFTVTPTSTLSLGRGDALPSRSTFSLTPKEEGRHSLVVSAPELLRCRYSGANEPNGAVGEPSPGEIIALDYSGRSQLDLSCGTLTLPIAVTTIWGLSRLAVGLVSLAAAAVGTVLGWPLVQRRLQHDTSMKATTEPSS